MDTQKITNEQAYVLGALVGGGTIANGNFEIILPLDKWGSEAKRASAISRDLLTNVRKIFFDAYKININYTIDNKKRWVITPVDNPPDLGLVLSHLKSLSLPTTGKLLSTAELLFVKKYLTGMRAEYFLSGIFDAKASLAESHRRFDSSAPVVSIEVPGSTMNFKFVVQLCSWLTDLGSVTDQILFNHPSQHATSNPAYKGWKKGFKIRFLVRSFLAKYSFSMRSKAHTITALERTQAKDEQYHCRDRSITANTISIHNDIHYPSLPVEVRSKVFLHYHHICAAMGCPYAPVDAVKSLMPSARDHLMVFPRSSKGEYSEMLAEYRQLAKDYSLTGEFLSNMKASHIQDTYLKSDYPDIEIALAYLLSDELNGKRHRGNMDDILSSKKDVKISVLELQDEKLAPLFIGIKSINRGVIVSSPAGSANQKAVRSLIAISGINIDVKQ